MSAKKSRINQIQSSPQSKPKKHSCCLCCFGGSASESSSEIYLEKDTEATDLLIEKMVVQRVPIRLFATEEDYKKIKAERSEKATQLSTRPFATYYSTLPKTDIKTVSTTKPRPMEHSAISLHNGEVEVSEEKFPFRENKNEDSERKLKNVMVNNFACLQALDSRGASMHPCPEDFPRKSVPSAATSVPSHLRYLRNSPAEARTSATLQVGGTNIRRELTPEMKDTLLMLGSAKKPINYKFQKHFNQKRKNMRVANDSSAAIEPTNAALYYDYDVFPKAPNLPDEVTWRISNPYDKSYPELNSAFVHDPHTIASIKQKLKDGYTYPSRNTKRYGSRYMNSEEEQGITEPIYVETSRCKTAPKKKHHSEEQSVKKPQITEIKQMKGSYLKWRIIIRHRNKSEE